MSSNNDITITLTCLSTQRTDSIEISPSTTLLDLCQYAAALLELSSSDNLILTKNTKTIYNSNTSSDSSSQEKMTLSSAGIKNGDLIVILQGDTSTSISNSTSGGNSSTPIPTTASIANSSSSSTGGALDFSSLLSSMNTPSNSTNTSTANGNNVNSNNVGGLHFNLPMLSLVSQQPTQTTPVQWDGMTLDDAIHRNPNPECFIKVLLDEQRHENLLKELNYHNAPLARKIKSAGLQNAANIWKQEMQRNTLNSTMSKTMQLQKESEMEKRLQSNPYDVEANKYFGEKFRKKNVDEQYQQMMEEFPESLGRVLMLYIDTKVNGHPIQAFVDSGAQSTIMSSKCAEKCGLLHLLDTRFAGTAVGVGTGKISGRIHIAQVQISDHYFPCTITIMDSKDGLGDKNMDFLLGLDMLKRHRCNIDLSKNALVFRVGNSTFETKFLHEKDLDASKGGTKGFDAQKENAELEKMDEGRD